MFVYVFAWCCVFALFLFSYMLIVWGQELLGQFLRESGAKDVQAEWVRHSNAATSDGKLGSFD